jgi:ankyrin repeat protein
MTATSNDIIAAAKTDDVAALRAVAAHNACALHGGPDLDELTPLHYAAAAGALNAVRFLASDAIGADINAVRGNNFTPLHGAAMNGRTEICIFLLEQGANPNIQTDPQAYVPLHSAAWAGHTGAVAALLHAGARTDLLNYRHETPAQTARRQNHPDVAARIEAAARANGKENP